MKNNTKILSDSHVFERYLNGNLSKEDLLIVEKELNENQFFSDALDGYKNNAQAFKSLQKLKQKSTRFYSKSFVLNSFLIGVLFVGVFTAVYFMLPSENVDVIALKDVEELAQPQPKTLPKVIAPSPVIELSDSAIDFSPLKDVEKQVSYKLVTKEQQDKEEESLMVVDSVSTKIKLEKVEQIKVEPIAQEPSVDVSKISIPLISLHGLINVNYSKIESGYSVKKQKVVMNGVPANMEHNQVRNNEPSHELVVQKIPYHSYLKDVQFYFSKNKFKKALKGYKEILKQHPSDLNAHFYSAICYYNINQSSKALEHLKVVNEHQYDTFRQEGEWYTVLSLLDLKKYKAANSVLQNVIKREEFYYNQAINLDKELKDQK